MEKKKLVKFVNDLNNLVDCDDDLIKVLCLCFVLFADYIDLKRINIQNRLVDHMEDELRMFIGEQLKDFPVLSPVAEESKETIRSIATALEYIFLASRIYYEKGFHTSKEGKILEPDDSFYIRRDMKI